MKLFLETAKWLGCAVQLNTHDSGQTLHITRGPGEVFHGSYEWGEEEVFFPRVARFLAALAAPTEDDPRVQHEGVTA